VSAPQTIGWLARHELRLSWRDWLAMMTGGRRGRLRVVLGALLVFLVFVHLIAYSIVRSAADHGIPVDKATLIVVTGSALLSWSLMLSQAIEMVTRAFYARADLDLVLCSPVSTRRVFAVRIGAIAISATFLAIPFAGPFINALAFVDGPHWLAAYGVLVAMGAAATAVSVTLAVLLFATLGPKRTRFLAQVVAAVVGAAFVIGIQAAAIFSTGTLSRIAALRSPQVAVIAPDLDSAYWWPARAAMGEPAALAAIVAIAFGLLLAAILAFSMRFADYATAAAGLSSARISQRSTRNFRAASPGQILRRKEWLLLQRDPWLVSQTLIQILYLLPPALLLWRNFSEGHGALIVLVPVIVMAAGQLAGGLAWLAVSGEDAPDLVRSAPVPAHRIVRAKVEAVSGLIALIVAPMIIVLLVASPFDAIVSIGGVLLAAGSATLIQFWFRTQAKRSQFRRRQTSSRMATFAEAFSSIAWAATAFLAAATSWLALIPGAAALAVLGGARLIRPRQAA
jgi:ABC-2 type transport system permease protein